MAERKDPQQDALIAAVCEVMREVKEVEKTGYNEKQNYHFASDADILSAVQPAMAKHGLALIPGPVEATTVEAGQSRSGNTVFRTDVRVTYRLCHSSGTSVEVQSCGSGSDNADKGIYKAMTGALKYALCQIFLIPRLMDAERHDAPDVQRRSFASEARERARAEAEDRRLIATSKDGKRFLTNWGEFVKDGLLTLVPIGARCGEPISALSAAEVENYDSLLRTALAGEVPADKRPALEAFQAALAVKEAA